VSRNNLHERFELQAIFDLGKALNSSLNLNKILNTLLLTLMGKFLISKGAVLVQCAENEFRIEAVKGLPQNIVGKKSRIDNVPAGFISLHELKFSSSETFSELSGIEVILPIERDAHLLGFVGLSKKWHGDSFSETEVEYLHSVLNISATAVHNSLIFRKLETEKRKSDKRVQELNTLAEIVKELNSSLSTLKSGKVVNLLAYSIMGEMIVNRCLIFLVEGENLDLVLNKGLTTDVIEQINTKENLAKLLNIKNACLIDEGDEQLCGLVDLGINAVIPMNVENEMKGIIALGQKITKIPFSDDELRLLSILGNWAVISIETARLIEQELEKKSLEEELRIASEIQRKLLPKENPTLEKFEVAGLNMPSLQVGGDYFDWVKISEDEYAFCIADVSGKGAPAALLMSNLQASFHALLGLNIKLTDIVARINNIIYQNTSSDKFITAFFGVLNTSKFTLNTVNAGHNHPYFYHQDNRFQVFDKGGLILGMIPDVQYFSESVDLQTGDLIVMFTDGISEAMNRNEELFEEHRIKKCISDNCRKSAASLLDALIAEVRDFSAGCPQADDITVLTIRVK